MPLQANKLSLEDIGTAATKALGDVLISNGTFQMQDGVGAMDPRTVWFAQHRDNPQLAHLYGSYAGVAAYRQIIGQPFPTSIIDYYDSNMTKIACREDLTRDSIQRVTLSTLSIYATDGVTLITRATRAITYTGMYVTQVVTTRTV